MKQLNLPASVRFLPFAMLVVLAACSGDNTPTDGLHALAAPPPGGPAPLSMPYLGATEFACVQQDFTDRFKVGTVASPQPMALKPLRFTVADLKAAVNDVASCDSTGEQVGVVVHFGMDSTNRFDVALEFVCLTPIAGTDPVIYQHPAAERHYILAGDHLQLVSDPVDAWVRVHGTAYADTVVIDRATASGWDHYLSGYDVNAITFPWADELQLLIDQNGLADTELLELVPIARPERRIQVDGTLMEYDYRQGICWLGVNVTLTDTEFPGQLFREKGADMGSGCPAVCPPLATFPVSGVQRRNGC
jgi:hypothetical protein